MDVETTFLNGVIEEEVYIEQPEGFGTHEKHTRVCRLKKSLCGLKQAPRAWYGQIDSYLQQLGFIKSDADPNLYYLMVENEPLILVLYVDDLFFTEDCKRNLATKFDMKDMGLMHYFLGLEVWQKNGEIFLGQGIYATKILKRFRMQDYRPMATPMITNWKKIVAFGDREVDPTLYRQLIGSLMYLVNTRPDICFVVNTLSQFMVEPKRVHWAEARHILKYVRGTFGLELKYTRVDDVRRKQKSVALSSTKVEYMAANTATCEAIWLRKSLVSFFRKKMGATSVYCDNQSAIKLSENPVFHDRLKQIDIRCHFIRDCVQHGAVQL
eukprot:PITA_28944